jgi:hypothetical protein
MTPNHRGPRIHLLSPGGQLVEVELESRRYCDGCSYWRRHQCALLGCELPVYASPHRPKECLDAEAAVKELAR